MKQKTRWAVWALAKQDAPIVVCVYCRATLTRRTMTVDHVVPRSKGGTDALDNLVPSCKRCNEAKADGPPPSSVRILRPTQRVAEPKPAWPRGGRDDYEGEDR